MRAAAACLAVLATLVIGLAPAAGLAEDAPVDAAYGNKDGCLYANTGETNGSDDFLLMTTEAITTFASYCEFKTIDARQADGFRATVACQEEGMEDGSDFKLAITRLDEAYTIKFDDGTTWGPLKRCK